jgi:hypothetical protein
MLVHASITMTLDLYGDLFPALHEQTPDKLDAMFVASQQTAERVAELDASRSAHANG